MERARRRGEITQKQARSFDRLPAYLWRQALKVSDYIRDIEGAKRAHYCGANNDEVRELSISFSCSSPHKMRLFGVAVLVRSGDRRLSGVSWSSLTRGGQGTVPDTLLREKELMVEHM